MAVAPVVEIDPAAFRADPYPVYRRLRAEAPVAWIPQLGAVALSRMADIRSCERKVAIFSSHQPDGLMNRLMGHNLMRKDGRAHRAERNVVYPALSPETVAGAWKAAFEETAAALLADLAPRGECDLVADYAMPLSGEALKAITGLVGVSHRRMDAWSQAMIDGIANYAGDPAVEARCRAATAEIDAAIDARAAELRDRPDNSLLGVMLAAGMAMESARANVKLAISGGQNEPRDAIAGAAWALLAHPEQRALVEDGDVSWLDAFEEYARWISPIGMTPRRIARRHEYKGAVLEPEDRVFLLFASANRDEDWFDEPDRFDARRDASRSVAFGAGPHFCAGAWASRALVAEVALPRLFAALPNLRLADPSAVAFDGWAFRGPLRVPVAWDRPGAPAPA